MIGQNHVVTSEEAHFLPELWSDEVVAQYKQGLVMPSLMGMKIVSNPLLEPGTVLVMGKEVAVVSTDMMQALKKI